MPEPDRRKPRSVRHFLFEEKGSATIEMVLWLPVLLFILAVITDASLIFGTRAQILRVIQDANRGAAIGKFMTAEATETFIVDNLGDLADVADVETVFAGGVVTSTVSVPSAELTATGFFSGFAGFDVIVTTQHRLEA